MAPLYKAGRAPDRKRQTDEPERLKLLLDISNAIVSHLDLHELFKAISERLHQVIDYDVAGLALYDVQEKGLRVHVLQGDIEGVTPLAEGLRVSVTEDTPAGIVFNTRRATVFRLAELQRMSAQFVQRVLAAGLRCSAGAPLIAHDRVLGTLQIGSRREDAFDSETLETLDQIAGQVAIAVSNAINFDKMQAARRDAARDRDRSRLLLEVNNAVVTHLDLRDLMRFVSSSLQKVFKQDFIGLALRDPETNQLQAHALHSTFDLGLIKEGVLIPLESPGGVALSLGTAVYLPQPDPERFPADVTHRLFELGVKSVCAVPLIAHSRKLGALTVMSLRENSMTEDDVELLEQIAKQIALAVENALAFEQIVELANKLTKEKLYLEDEIRTEYNFEEIIGQSKILKRALSQVEKVAPADTPVLICGETGTGKELIARAIHHLSARSERTMVKVNCAAIPTGLLESELFGHEKGAFTGATSQRIGRFELAHGGTLFLDEVGDIPLELQPKLLRVLQEQEFERLGSTRTIRVDVRIVAATNVDLEQMVGEKKFRSDLFYRLNVFPVMLPPLRERKEDIPLLVSFFAQKYARRLKRRIERIPAEAMAALIDYAWPGNIRELENLIERAVLLSQGDTLRVDLPSQHQEKGKSKAAGRSSQARLRTLAEIDRDYILEVLRRTGGTIAGKGGAADILGMPPSTLRSRMEKLGIR